MDRRERPQEEEKEEEVEEVEGEREEEGEEEGHRGRRACPPTYRKARRRQRYGRHDEGGGRKMGGKGPLLKVRTGRVRLASLVSFP